MFQNGQTEPKGSPETVQRYGSGDDCYAMSTKEHNFIRCAYGNACTSLDDMLFDVKNDRGLVLLI